MEILPSSAFSYSDSTPTGLNPQNSPELGLSLTHLPPSAVTATPQGEYRIDHGVGADANGDRFLAPAVTPTPRLSDLERFLLALGMNPNRPIAVTCGENRLYLGTAKEQQPCKKIDGVWQPYGHPRPIAALDKTEKGGVFWRPNLTGHTDQTWEGSQVLFWEVDDAPLAEQQDRADCLAGLGLRYRAKVFTGGKSLHFYIAIEPTTDPEQWRRVQQKLIVLMDSDSQIRTLSRNMRLPGFHRFKDGKWVRQELLEVTNSPTYSIEAVEAILDSTGLFPRGMQPERFTAWATARSNRRTGATENADPWEVLTKDFDLERKLKALSQWEGERVKPSIELVRDALRFVPPRTLNSGNYGECLRILAGLVHEFGEADAIALGEEWSPSIPGNSWQIRTKVRTLLKGSSRPATIGTVFHIAMEHGWDFPTERETTGSAPASKVISIDGGKGGEDYRNRTRDRWVKRQTFTPDQITTGQYLPPLPETDVGVNAPFGVGKTYRGAEVVSNHGGGFMQPTHRNGYASAAVARYNEAGGKPVYFARDENPGIDVNSPEARLVGCIDTLGKLRNNWGTDLLALLDEVVQLQNHTLIGGTVEGNRDLIVKGLTHILLSAGRLVLMDGNLSDSAVSFVEKLSGKKIHKIKHIPDNPVRVTYNFRQIEDEPTQIDLPLNEIGELLEAGKRVVVACEVKAMLKALEVRFGHKYNTRMIHGDNSGEKHIQPYLADTNLGQTLKDEGVQLFGYSSTLSCGTDIQDSGFDVGYFIVSGILPTAEQTQMPRRVRDLLEWEVYCVEYCLLRDEGQRSSFGGTVAKNQLEALGEELLQFPPETLEALKAQGFPMVSALIDDPIFREQCELRADRNYEKQHTRECLKWMLEQQGHIVSETTVPPDSARLELRQIKSQINIDEANKIYSNCGDDVPLPEAQARAIINGDGASLELRLKAERTMLLCRLPGLGDSPLWSSSLVLDLLRKNKRAIAKLERYWLSQHLDIAQQRSQMALKNVLEGYGYLGDLKTDLAKFKALEQWGVLRLIGNGVQYTKDSPELVALLQKVKRSKKAKALGLAPRRGDDPVKWLRRILEGLFDCQVPSDRIKAGDQRDDYLYSFEPPKHKALLEFVEARYTELSQKWADDLADFWGQSALSSLRKNSEVWPHSNDAAMRVSADSGIHVFSTQNLHSAAPAPTVRGRRSTARHSK